MSLKRKMGAPAPKTKLALLLSLLTLQEQYVSRSEQDPTIKTEKLTKDFDDTIASLLASDEFREELRTQVSRMQAWQPKCAVPVALHHDQYLRLPQIIGDPKADPPIAPIVPVCRSAWWAGVKSHRYPQPVKLSPRVTVWKSADIAALLARSEVGGEA